MYVCTYQGTLSWKERFPCIEFSFQVGPTLRLRRKHFGNTFTYVPMYLGNLFFKGSARIQSYDCKLQRPRCVNLVIYNATSSLLRFENTIFFLYFEERSTKPTTLAL
jgi:hypothetical protein